MIAAPFHGTASLFDQLQRDRSMPARSLLRFWMRRHCTRLGFAQHCIAQGFQFCVFNPAEFEPELENGHRQQLGGFGVAAGDEGRLAFLKGRQDRAQCFF